MNDTPNIFTSNSRYLPPPIRTVNQSDHAYTILPNAPYDGGSQSLPTRPRIREMMPLHGFRLQANNQEVTHPEFPDKRETVKSPVNPSDFSVLIKHTRSGLSHLARAHGGSHRDEADIRPAPGIEARLSGAQSTPLTLPIRPPSTIPMLRPIFFKSDFWHQFHAQRPLLEPSVFLPRLEESLGGTTDSLGVPGRLAAMCLVMWAASFGHDEEGKMVQSSNPQNWRLSVKSRTNSMVKELLYLVDSYGIIRKPTWDVLAVLLTILPLTKEIISDSERATLHRLTMNAVESLVYDFKHTTSPEERLKKDLRPLARAFWWCIIQDWMAHPSSGGRVILTTGDMHSLESLLPPLSPPAGSSPAEKDSIQNFMALRQYFAIPLKLASAYRLVRGILSDPEFVRGDIDETRLTTVWSTLDVVWNTLKNPGTLKLFQAEGSEYSRIWKLFVFECYIYLDITFNQTMAIQPERSTQLSRACNATHSKCRALLGTIIRELKEFSRTSLGQYDACGLSKPIYSVAAFIARSPNVGTKEDFLVCLKALQQTRWVYSDHETKVADLRFLWNASRDEPLGEPPESLESPTSPDTFEDFLLRLQPRTPPSPPPFSPTFRSSTTKSARSRGSSGGSFCISEGHNSPDDDVPSRKSPNKLARVLAILEKKNPGSRRK